MYGGHLIGYLYRSEDIGVIDQTSMINKGFITSKGLSGKFFLWDTQGSHKRARWHNLSHSGIQS